MVALVSIDVDFSGLDRVVALDPRRAEVEIEQWSSRLLDSFSNQGLSEVHHLMDRAFQHPTPYYETQVTVDASAHERVIHDRGIVYGPWLEGVGSRNRTTRFKGYAHWRRTGQWLADVEGPRIISRHVPDLVRRLS